jgi:aspartate oxidase
MQNYSRVEHPKITSEGPLVSLTKDQVLQLKEVVLSVKSLAWKYLGIVRTEKGLHKALRELVAIQNKIPEELKHPLVYSAVSLCIVGYEICNAALNRQESVGAHRRE